MINKIKIKTETARFIVEHDFNCIRIMEHFFSCNTDGVIIPMVIGLLEKTPDSFPVQLENLMSEIPPEFPRLPKVLDSIFQKLPKQLPMNLVQKNIPVPLKRIRNISPEVFFKELFC